MSISRYGTPLDRAARTAAKQAVARIARRLVPHREDFPLATWGLSRDASGDLALGPANLRELLVRHASPLHVVDARALARNATRFAERPQGANRGCEVFCSYKTSPVPGILQFLHARGLGAEVVSAYELWLALRLGIDPESIVYNGPAKSTESVVLALNSRVGLININSRTEIAHLASLARRLGRRPKVGIRVVVPGCVGGQFGERIDTGAALHTFGEALQCEDLRVVALHFHSNGKIASTAQLDALLSPLLSFADELFTRFGLTLQIMDVGGNLVCPTVSQLSSGARRLAVTLGCQPKLRPPEELLSIDDYVAHVVRRIESHFSERSRPVPRIFVEPGRALTSNAQMLLCKVVTVRDPDEIGIRWAVLDAGVHLAEPMTSELHQLFAISPRPDAPPRLHRLTGPSCMLSDQVYPAWTLPELAPGDGLAIMDTGAYFVAFSTPFSSPRPAVVMVDAGREQLLRRRETFEDLLSLDSESLGPGTQRANLGPLRRSEVDKDAAMESESIATSEAR